MQKKNMNHDNADINHVLTKTNQNTEMKTNNRTINNTIKIDNYIIMSKIETANIGYLTMEQITQLFEEQINGIISYIKKQNAIFLIPYINININININNIVHI